MRPSDSLRVVCLPCWLRLSGILVASMIGCHSSVKNLRVSLLALMTPCLARAGERPRVSSRGLPLTRREVLPSSVNKPWADSNRYKISGLMPFIAAGPPTVDSPSLPCCVRFNCRLRPRGLLRQLQHSILGLWLAVTQAGTPPACHQTISSPHVHAFVRRSEAGQTVPIQSAMIHVMASD